MSVLTAGQVDRNINLVRRFGGSNTDAILDASTQIFCAPEIDGLIGYRTVGNLAVVFGDPISDPINQGKLAEAFEKEMHSKGMHTITISASKNYAEWALENVCKASIEFGEEIILDPGRNVFSAKGKNASLVRRKVRHAISEGVTVEEYSGNDPLLENNLQRVGVEWVKGRSGPQIHISGIDLFREREGKRWFYAKEKNQIIGVVVLNRLLLKNGWLMNHLMTTPSASHGTPEILVNHALTIVSEEGCRYVTTGAAPYPALKEITGFSPFLSLFARLSYQYFKHRFKLGGRKKFWEKFSPASEPLYLLFSSNTFTLKEITGLLKTLQD